MSDKIDFSFTLTDNFAWYRIQGGWIFSFNNKYFTLLSSCLHEKKCDKILVLVPKHIFSLLLPSRYLSFFSFLFFQLECNMHKWRYFSYLLCLVVLCSSSMVWCLALILEKSQPLQFKYFSLYFFSSFLFFLFLFSYFFVLPFGVWYILHWFYSFGIFCFIFYFCISACVVSIYISSSSPILSSACLICWGFMKAVFTSITVCFYC